MFDFDFDFNFDFDSDEDEKFYIKKQRTKEVIKKQITKVEQIGIPTQEQQFRIVTKKSINSFAIIQNFLKNNTIDDMYMAYYSIGRDVTDIIIDGLKEKKIKKATILVSDFFKSQDKDWLNALDNYQKHNKNIKFSVFNTHTKIAIFKIKKDYYVIEGSGNLTMTAKLENYIFENDRKMYNFHKKWIKELVDLDYIHKGNMKGAIKR